MSVSCTSLVPSVGLFDVIAANITRNVAEIVTAIGAGELAAGGELAASFSDLSAVLEQVELSLRGAAVSFEVAARSVASAAQGLQPFGTF